MIRVGFESLIPAFEQQKTAYTPELTAVAIGLFNLVNHNPMAVYLIIRQHHHSFDALLRLLY
jgi:hypothetical protein